MNIGAIECANIVVFSFKIPVSTYTFNNLDYSEYKNKLLNYIYGSKLLTKSSNIVSESYVGEEATISVDYSEYDIESEGVKILSNDSNGIKYTIEDELPEIKTLKLNPKDSDEAKSFVFKS